MGFFGRLSVAMFSFVPAVLPSVGVKLMEEWSYVPVGLALWVGQALVLPLVVRMMGYATPVVMFLAFMVIHAALLALVMLVPMGIEVDGWMAFSWLLLVVGGINSLFYTVIYTVRVRQFAY